MGGKQSASPAILCWNLVMALHLIQTDDKLDAVVVIALSIILFMILYFVKIL